MINEENKMLLRFTQLSDAKKSGIPDPNALREILEYATNITLKLYSKGKIDKSSIDRYFANLPGDSRLFYLNHNGLDALYEISLAKLHVANKSNSHSYSLSQNENRKVA